ncbi:MAG: AraC family transcriptional regulator [Nannocystales bacterium]
MTESEPWVDRIQRVVDHIQDHLDDDLRPEHLADLAGFSRHHFHRVFRGIADESVMAYVRRLRLERAAQHLKYGPASVTEVAFSAGYTSHEAFTRAFTANFGKSPSLYREEVASALRDVPIVLRHEPARRVIALRHIGAYEACFSNWDRLTQWAKSQRLTQRATPDFGLCYDDPDVTDDARIRYDVCVAAPTTGANLGDLPEGMSERTVPGGRYAVATHHGPYETINDTYVALIGKWLPRRGVELHNEPVLEIYRTGPDVAPEAELVTEICVRVAEAR